MKLPSPQELDAQSPVNISKWVDVDSEECRSKDDNHSLTKKWLKMGLQDPAFFHLDSNGRIWGIGNGGQFYPFHFECGKKLIGYRISSKAAN